MNDNIDLSTNLDEADFDDDNYADEPHSGADYSESGNPFSSCSTGESRNIRPGDRVCFMAQ